ncbi:MAG: hypothetical protein QGF09_07810 [Rhodospirillales bacterium]|jgi:predicted acyl esterase|nr:hypothetical protein [Rhodospirillales bacterium]
MARKSKAKFDMRVESGIHITMRDGLRLTARVYRPDNDGAYPAETARLGQQALSGEFR